MYGFLKSSDATSNPHSFFFGGGEGRRTALPYVSCFVAWCCGTVQNGAERCCPISLVLVWCFGTVQNGAERCCSICSLVASCFVGTAQNGPERSYPIFHLLYPCGGRANEGNQDLHQSRLFKPMNQFRVFHISDGLGQQAWYRGTILATAEKVEYCSPFFLGTQVTVLCVAKVNISTRGMVKNSHQSQRTSGQMILKRGLLF